MIPYHYIIEVLLCGGLFAALYKLLLEGCIAHRAARAYLVGGALLSVVIPAMEIPLYPARFDGATLPAVVGQWSGEEFFAREIATEEANAPQGQVVHDGAASSHTDIALTAGYVLAAVYLAVLLLNLSLFVRRLRLIARLRRCCYLSTYEACTLAVSDRVREPFSFWRTIFMNRWFTGAEREQVLVHELSHVRHRHTAERLVLELLRCIFWFNPFTYLAARWLTEVQEWEADGDVLGRGYDIYEYRTIILRQLFGYNPDITCGLNNQITKKRFLMMTDFRRDKLSFIRLGAAVPLVTGMILAFGCVNASADTSAADTPARTASAVAIEFYKPCNGGEIRGAFGNRVHPVSGKEMMHEGVDIALDEGAPVFAVADGVVKSVSLGDAIWGNSVVISHAEGYESRYAHLSQADVAEGSSVSGGGMIGKAGSTGRVTGPHLHFELRRDGIATDPSDVVTDGKSESKVTVRICGDGGYEIDGRKVSVADIESELKSAARGRTVVNIECDEGVAMERVYELRYALRKAGILRVSYAAADKRVDRVLPPIDDESVLTSVIVIDPKSEPEAGDKAMMVFKSRNMMEVSIGADGRKSVRMASARDLKNAVKEFVKNEKRDANLAETVPTKIDVSDSVVIISPVSKGVVSLLCKREAAYSSYVDVLNSLNEAFTELRDEMSQRVFDRPFAELNEAETSAVMRAIPVKVLEGEAPASK